MPGFIGLSGECFEQMDITVMRRKVFDVSPVSDLWKVRSSGVGARREMGSGVGL